VARRAVLLSTVLVLLLGTGCSSDADSGDAAREQELETTFKSAFSDISQQYRTSMAEVQGQGRAALQSQDRDKVLDVYRAMGDATAKSREQFSKLTPPGRIAEQFEALLDNLQQQKTALDSVVAAAQAEQDAPLTDGLQEFSALLVEFGTIQESIQTKLTEDA
jgi:chromosome segregation ATPase